MGSSASAEYCAFTKAVEHLGDRWSFLVVRELAMFGPQGFNALASGLPGHISRSVLAAKLRKLEELGIVTRDAPSGSGGTPYRLAPAGEQLVPTLMSLLSWAEHWVPENPAVAERDPTVITAWLKQRVDPAASPRPQVAVELILRGDISERCWLVLARDTDPSLCLEDPLLDEDRYVYVQADAAALYPIARGTHGWIEAIADGAVEVYGDPALVRSMPSWFLPHARVTKPAMRRVAAA